MIIWNNLQVTDGTSTVTISASGISAGTVTVRNALFINNTNVATALSNVEAYSADIAANTEGISTNTTRIDNLTTTVTAHTDQITALENSGLMVPPFIWLEKVWGDTYKFYAFFKYAPGITVTEDPTVTVNWSNGSSQTTSFIPCKDKNLFTNSGTDISIVLSFKYRKNDGTTATCSCTHNWDGLNPYGGSDGIYWALSDTDLTALDSIIVPQGQQVSGCIELDESGEPQPNCIINLIKDNQFWWRLGKATALKFGCNKYWANTDTGYTDYDIQSGAFSNIYSQPVYFFKQN